MERHRRDKRHAVNGPALLRSTTKSQQTVAECCNVSATGVLLRSRDVPPDETEVWVYFRLADQNFVVPGEIVRTDRQQVAVVFREKPQGLEQALRAVEQRGRDRRSQERIHLITRVRLQRQSGESEVVQPIDVSAGGFGFESVRAYQLGEKLSVALHYNPEEPDAEAEWAVVVRAELLPQWDAYSYGVEFLSPAR